MTAESLRAVYRKNLLKYHPDKIQSRESRAATEDEVEKFRNMQNVYTEYLKRVKSSSAPEPPKPAPKTTKTEPPKPAPKTTKTEPPKPAPKTAKPKHRCCGVCGKPGHTRTTCPLVNPKKAAQRMRAERNKQKRENTHVPPKAPPTPAPPKSEPPAPPKSTPPASSKTSFVAETVSVIFAVKFIVPKGVKVGDVIKIPYTIPGPTGPKHMTHDFVMGERHMKYKNLFVNIPI